MNRMACGSRLVIVSAAWLAVSALALFYSGGTSAVETTVVENTAALDASQTNTWWAFQPVKRPLTPQPKNGEWVESEIDRFVLAKLEEKDLHPVADADPAALLRRISFDLTGLPANPEKTAEFVSNWNGQYEKGRRRLLEQTVDTLLRSPQYGERWGRHWLDVARYAESSGKDVNVVYPHAWRYRDYVIQAFREDRPFNRFLIEQIAGDLLPSRSDAERGRNLIATGFLALGSKSLNEIEPRQFAVEVADEQIDTVTQAILGLTVACARCHDHKFDPISQQDYTSLAGIFLSTDTRFGTPGGVQGRNESKLVELPAGSRFPIVAKGMSATDRQAKQIKLDRLRQKQYEALDARQGGKNATDGLTNFDVVRIITQATELEAELSVTYDNGTPKPLAMGVADKPLTVSTTSKRAGRRTGRKTISGFETIADSPLFAHGNIENAKEKVPRGVPAIVAPNATAIPASSSGRLQLAEALASPSNPLTSRVIVNRVWYWLFGRGLVDSVDNFGTTGSLPSHPELLDYLADRFMREGWSVKRLVREIVLSHTYRLSAEFDEQSFAADPDNTLLWRHSRRRLDAEEIRDATLAATGRLSLAPQAGSLIGRAGDGPIGGPRNMAVTEEQVARADNDSRSIYLPIARNVQPDILSVFDFPDAAACEGARQTTNVPSQALFLINSDFVSKQAERMAERIVTALPGRKATAQFDERLKLAYSLTFGRPPRESEAAAARKLVERHARDATAAWTSISRALFASAEFRLID